MSYCAAEYRIEIVLYFVVTHRIILHCIARYIVLHCTVLYIILTLLLSVGDDCCGAGLPLAPSHGLPHGAAPAHAGVLGEGEEPEAKVLPNRQHPGQASPQRRHPQGGHQHILRVSGGDWKALFLICTTRPVLRQSNKATVSK